MNVEIGAEAALFPEKEYINGIAVAVHFNMGEGGPGTRIMSKWRWWERLPGEVLELAEDVQAEELMLVREVDYFPVFETCQVKLKRMRVDIKLQHTAKTQY